MQTPTDYSTRRWVCSALRVHDGLVARGVSATYIATKSTPVGFLTTYLFTALLLGVAAGYGLWRLWGEQENIEKYKAAERRLAEYLAQWEREAH